MKYLSKSEKETIKIARDFAAKLKGGEVLLMIGDLGAGKTAFTKGLAIGLGITNIITSPTFVLMKVYETKTKAVSKKASHHLSLAHIDAYRLKSGTELEAIGATDYFGDSGFITVIEWAERIKDIWPDDAIKIEFKIGKGNLRTISIKRLQ